MQNRHLPGIPSSEEIANNGIEMGNMQAKTMEKVKEVVLYLLEVKKENDKVKKQNEILKTS